MIREERKFSIRLYLSGICCLGNQICRCNCHFWRCIPGYSPPHTDILKSSQPQRPPWDSLQANWGKLSPEKPHLGVFLHIVSAQACGSAGLDYGGNKGIILTAKREKQKMRETNVFQIRQFICFLASGCEQWSLHYLKGFGASGRNCFSMCSIGAHS